MARITADKFAELLEAYRNQGLTISHAEVSRGTDTPVRTCYKAYSDGYPKRTHFPHSGKAIKVVLLEEAALARSALVREKAPEVATVDAEAVGEMVRRATLEAMVDVAGSRAAQGKTIRASRSNALALLVSSQHLLKAVRPIAAELANDLSGRPLDINTRMKILREVASFAKSATEVAKQTEQMEAAALGDPRAIINLMDEQSGVGMTQSEALLALKEAEDALRRSKEDGIVVERVSEDDVVDVEFSEITTEGRREPTENR